MILNFLFTALALVLEPLLLLAFCEQIFWEGDSLVFLKVAIVLSILFLGYSAFRKSDQRFSISLWFVILLSLLLSFQMGVALDVSQYQRIEAIRTTIALGQSELLEIVALLCLVYISFREKSVPIEVKIASISITNISLISSLTLISLQSFRHGLSFQFNTGSDLWLSTSLTLILARFLSRGTKPLLSARFNRNLNRATAYFAFLFTAGVIAITCHCIYLTRDPLPFTPNNEYKVTNVFLLRLLASEDPIFLSHFGINFKRIRDKTRETLEVGEFNKGGSTITMQLAKVHYLYFEKTLLRKLQQVIIALILEVTYSKEEIMEAYLERVTYDEGLRGLTKASRELFGKNPMTLNANESLKLVMAIYDPALFNPRATSISPRASIKMALNSTRLKVYFQTLVQELSNFKIAVP